MNIVFLQPHTHAGTEYPAQAEAELDEASARWCIAAGVARAVSSARPRGRRDAAPPETPSIPPSNPSTQPTEPTTLESAP